MRPMKLCLAIRYPEFSVGTEHVLAIDSSRKKVLAWGWGEHGNCGPNHDARGLNIAFESVGNAEIKSVYAGYSTSWISFFFFEHKK